MAREGDNPAVEAAIAHTYAGSDAGNVRLLSFIHKGVYSVGYLEQELQVGIVGLDDGLLLYLFALLGCPGVLVAHSDIPLQLLELTLLQPARVEPHRSDEQHQEG